MRMMAADDDMKRRDSGIRLRSDIDATEALRGAQTVIARLQEEIARLGDALETQHERYERTLTDEREERRLVMQTRGDRTRRMSDKIATLGERNADLIAERDSAKWSQRRSAAALKQLRTQHEQAGQAYRASLRALRHSFEQQLDVA